MDIGQAVQAMREGKMVRRSGWNGKGMHLYLEDMLSIPIAMGAHAGTARKYEPFVAMFTAQHQHQPGWVCSQADLLATDWELVDG